MQAVGPTRTPASPPAETETPVRFVSDARHTARKVSQVLSPNAHRWDVHHGGQFHPSARRWHVHHGATFNRALIVEIRIMAHILHSEERSQ